MKTVRCSTRKARNYITYRDAFQSYGALRGVWVSCGAGERFGRRYVVYSYDAPIYLYDPDMNRWFENSGYHGYSVTTSKHYSQARPAHSGGIITVDDDTIHLILRCGAAHALAEQFAGGAA